MAKIKEYGYVQFPLCLLMETYTNAHDGLTMIEDFAIVKFAKTFNYNINDVACQLMYCYYREKKLMPAKLLYTMENYINEDKLSIDEEYYGFVGGKFDPLEHSSELIGLFETDQDFKKEAILLYQIRLAINTNCLNLTIGSMTSLINGYEAGKKIREDFEAQFGSDAMVSVKISQLIEFRASGKDLDLFRAFLAIKSLIGMKDFAEGNKPAILSRMIGCKSKEAFEHYTTKKYSKNSKLVEIVKIYGKRYHMDKLLLELRKRKFIMCVSKEQCRNMYFSSYMEPDELVKRVHASKENSMEVKLKNAAKLL